MEHKGRHFINPWMFIIENENNKEDERIKDLIEQKPTHIIISTPHTNEMFKIRRKHERRFEEGKA